MKNTLNPPSSTLLCSEETYAIRGAALEVYKEMGNGFDENVYQECMEIALSDRSIEFVAQQKLPLTFKGRVLKHFYQPDLYCFGKIIVELKACSALADVHRAQLLNYLRLTGCKLGLLINFGSSPKIQIERYVV